jgi:hypothetical protein
MDYIKTGGFVKSLLRKNNSQEVAWDLGMERITGVKPVCLLG